MSFLRVLCATSLMVLLMSESWAQRENFIDPMDAPAIKNEYASRGNLASITRAGARLVAVGSTGHILFSDDEGASWTQATVPVSTDLVAVYFPSANQGWAVGHDGIVLHSSDAGASWQQQMSGREIEAIAQKFYAAHPASGEQATEQEQALAALAGNAPAYSFLDVWFRDDQEGYAVGAFNLIFKTSDGGQTWQPWLDRTENPRGYHLYAIRGDASGVYIVGELGLMLRLDDSAQRFTALESPYQGTFFGVLLQGNHLIAYGLRGNAFVSEDRGQNWKKLNNPSDVSLASAVWDTHGDALLLSQAGELLRNKPGSLTLQRVTGVPAFPTNSAVFVGRGNGLAIVGPQGAKQVQFD